MDPILITLRIGDGTDPDAGALEGAASVGMHTGSDPAAPARRVCTQCDAEIPSLSAPFPVGYDRANRVFHLSGDMFCSLGCAQRRNLDIHGGTQHYWQVSAWLHLLAGREGLIIRPGEGEHGTVFEIPPHVVSCRDSRR